MLIRLHCPRNTLTRNTIKKKTFTLRFKKYVANTNLYLKYTIAPFSSSNTGLKQNKDCSKE